MKRFFLLCLLLYSVMANGQQFTMTISDKFHESVDGDFLKAGNFFYSLHGATLHKFDADMKEVKEFKLGDGENKSRRFSAALLYFNDNILLLYFRFSNDTLGLHLSKIDLQTLSPDEPKLLFTIRQVGSIAASTINPIFISTCPDNSKMMIAYETNMTLASCIIDKELELKRKNVAKVDLKDFDLDEILVDNKENKYFTYKFKNGKSTNRGICIENRLGQEQFQSFIIEGEDYRVGQLSLKNSIDNSKVYVYGIYGRPLLDGVGSSKGLVLATVDAEMLRINTPQLIAYPAETGKELTDLSFGGYSKGEYWVEEVNYDLIETEQGAIALIGQCRKVNSGISTTFSDGGFTNGPQFTNRYYSYSIRGPIVGCFINNEQTKFVVIPRKSLSSPMTIEKAGIKVLSWKNKVVCIYTDRLKGIADAPPEEKEKTDMTIVLAAAVFDNNGTMISQKKIADYPPVGALYLYSDQKISDNSYIFPVITTSSGIALYTYYIIRWANLTIE